MRRSNNNLSVEKKKNIDTIIKTINAKRTQKITKSSNDKKEIRISFLFLFFSLLFSTLRFILSRSLYETSPNHWIRSPIAIVLSCTLAYACSRFICSRHDIWIVNKLKQISVIKIAWMITILSLVWIIVVINLWSSSS